MTSFASTQADDQPRVGGGRDGQGARRHRTTGRVSQKSLCLSLGALQRVLPPGCPRRRRDVRRRRLSTHRLAPSGAGRPGPQRASQQMCSGDWPLLQSESMHEWFGQRACCSAAHGGVAMRDAAGSPHTGSPDVGWGGQDPSESQHGRRQHVPPKRSFSLSLGASEPWLKLGLASPYGTVSQGVTYCAR